MERKREREGERYVCERDRANQRWRDKEERQRWRSRDIQGEERRDRADSDALACVVGLCTQ